MWFINTVALNATSSFMLLQHLQTTVKENKLSLCLTKYHAMKKYGGAEV